MTGLTFGFFGHRVWRGSFPIRPHNIVPNEGWRLTRTQQKKRRRKYRYPSLNLTLPLRHVLIRSISAFLGHLSLPALLSHQPGSFSLSLCCHPTTRPLLRSWQMLHPSWPVSPSPVYTRNLQLLLQPNSDVGGHAFDLPPPPERPSRIILGEGVRLWPGGLPSPDRACHDGAPSNGWVHVVGVTAVGHRGSDGWGRVLSVSFSLVQAGLRGLNPASTVLQWEEGGFAAALAASAAADLPSLLQRIEDHFLPQLSQFTLLWGLLQSRHQVLHQLIHHGAGDQRHRIQQS